MSLTLSMPRPSQPMVLPFSTCLEAETDLGLELQSPVLEDQRSLSPKRLMSVARVTGPHTRMDALRHSELSTQGAKTWSRHGTLLGIVGGSRRAQPLAKLIGTAGLTQRAKQSGQAPRRTRSDFSNYPLSCPIPGSPFICCKGYCPQQGLPGLARGDWEQVTHLRPGAGIGARHLRVGEPPSWLSWPTVARVLQLSGCRSQAPSNWPQAPPPTHSCFLWPPGLAFLHSDATT